MLITIKPKKKLRNNSTIHRPAPPPPLDLLWRGYISFSLYFEYQYDKI